MRAFACLALLTGCMAHESGSAPVENNEPTIESKIGDPYAAAHVPPAAPPQPSQPMTMQADVVAMRAAPGMVETAGEALSGLFRRDKKEAVTEAEPDPNRQRPDKVVVEAWVTLVTDEVQPLAQQIRERVLQLGGRVTEDRVGGAASQSWEGQLKVRLRPGTVPGFLDWLAGRGEMVSRRVSATDVSRQYFDHQIALRNLELTMARLQKIVEQGALKVDELLHIEQEMTRVRTQIEQLKGAMRWIDDTVSFSTIEIRLTGTRPIPRLIEEKFHIGGRFGPLVLTDAAGREQTRWGGGAVLQFGRNFSLDLDGFSSVGKEGPTVLATMGGAAYTDFLGGGSRRFGNPFLGFRLGYGRLNHQDLFVLGAEVGVELVHLKYLTCELFVRPEALLGTDSDLVVQGGLGVSAPF